MLNLCFFGVTEDYDDFDLDDVCFERPDTPALARTISRAELFDIFETFERFDDLPPPGAEHDLFDGLPPPRAGTAR